MLHNKKVPQTIEGSQTSRRERRATAGPKGRAAISSSDLDFRRWFRECVDELPPSDDAPVWSRRLADQLENGEESDKTLRRYYNGETKRPWARSAFALGWALHDLGLAWCSGPVALAAAGHIVPFFNLLQRLSTQGRLGREAALRFAFASFKANVTITVFPQAMLLNRADARSAVEKAARVRSLIKEAWTSLCIGGPLQDVPPDFQFAFEIVKSGLCSEKLRVYGAVAVLAKSALDAPNSAEGKIVEDLTWLSPIARSLITWEVPEAKSL